ncbi:TRAP transporter large permease subunit [Aestuariivita sp.]|jgi:tripartite ATP-independent transporter DctM subunit|uniref:TRAP transporter large permease n=1 Tax=Aestuariivita sp. TaxID=1872407 RepID=UPI002172A443|nr:TRAP transporter large permease subunit [Aestuariivita sp.]MCE8009401.1 TRAP transporter large permease subunit [Aestuariivita sp.]
MSGEVLAALMLPCLFVFIFLGLPISFSLLVTAAIFAWPLFGDAVGNQLYGGLNQTASSFVLSAVPPFIFMGYMLERSGVAEKLFTALQMWLHRLPGGLALAAMGMAGILAAATGIVGAVEVLIGVMAIPAMMARNYDKALIAGVICAGGSLGTMIPPSIVVVIYATVAQMSVGQLFSAVMMPGLIMVSLFVAYVLIICILYPAKAPRDTSQSDVPLGEKLWITLVALVPMVLLIVAVLGSITFGIASPTEAASVGAVATVLLTIAYGRFTWSSFFDALRQTLIVNSMILMIVVGGTIFSGTFRIHGGNEMVRDLFTATGFGETGVILLMLLVVFIAGFVLDWVSVVLICLPIFIPIFDAFDIDMIWFAVLMIIVIQTSYLTPPMAPSIFYLRSIAPADITYKHMYLGVLPFIGAQVLTLLLVFWFPALAVWLPSVLVD